MNGNTKHSRNRGRNWFLTINNPTFNDDTLIRGCYRFIFQYEQGASGTIHIQGGVGFKNAVSFESVKAMFATAHIEKIRDINAVEEYCSKDDTKLSVSWAHNWRNKAQIGVDVIKELRPWQQCALDDINFNDNRHIHWYHESVGNIGKTSFAKYLCVHYNAIFVNGSGKDIKFAVANWKEKNNLIVIIGLTRTVEDHVSYAAMEEVKDGLFFSGKYESMMCVLNSPHIIVLANFAPDVSKMSADRWIIHDLNDDKMEIDIDI